MITLSLRAAVRPMVALFVSLALGGCRIEDVLNFDACAGSRGAVISIQLDAPASVRVQQQINVSGSAYGAEGFMLCPPTPTWSSSDPNIATVAPALNQPQVGTVSGVAVGSAYIRATFRAKTDSVRISVTP